MASKNSRKDPVMTQAVEDVKVLMADAAHEVRVALDAFGDSPRWCGLPDPKRLGSYDVQYPHAFELRGHILMEPGEVKLNGYNTIAFPKTEHDGHVYHQRLIDALARRLEAGWVPAAETVFGTGTTRILTPRRWLDDVRKYFRYDERLDTDGMLPSVFALLRPVPKGKVEEDTARPVGPDGKLPKRQLFEYVSIVEQTLDAKTFLPSGWCCADGQAVGDELWVNVLNVSRTVRKIFDRVAVALMPTKADLEPDDRKFLEWMGTHDWKGTSSDINTWLTQNHMSGGGQMIKQCVEFCDKLGPSRGREPWYVRPEAQALL